MENVDTYYSLNEVIGDRQMATQHAETLIASLTEPADLWRVLAQVSRQIDRIDPDLIADDLSHQDPRETLTYIQNSLDGPTRAMSRLFYPRGTK